MYNKIGHKYKIIIFKLLHQLVGSLSPPIFSVVVSVFRRRIWAPVPAIKLLVENFYKILQFFSTQIPRMSWKTHLSTNPISIFSLFYNLHVLSNLVLCSLLSLFSLSASNPLFLFTTCMYCAARSGTFCWAGSCLGAKRIRTICIFNLFTLADSNCEPFPIKCSGKRKYYYSIYILYSIYIVLLLLLLLLLLYIVYISLQYLSNFTISSHHLWRGKYLQSPV